MMMMMVMPILRAIEGFALSVDLIALGCQTIDRLRYHRPSDGQWW